MGSPGMGVGAILLRMPPLRAVFSTHISHPTAHFRELWLRRSRNAAFPPIALVYEMKKDERLKC